MVYLYCTVYNSITVGSLFEENKARVLLENEKEEEKGQSKVSLATVTAKKGLVSSKVRTVLYQTYCTANSGLMLKKKLWSKSKEHCPLLSCAYRQYLLMIDCKYQNTSVYYFLPIEECRSFICCTVQT